MEITKALQGLAKFSAGPLPVISVYLNTQWRITPRLPRGRRGRRAAGQYRRNRWAPGGDVIQEVNRQPVQSVRDFARAVERVEPHPLVLFITRYRTTLYLVLEPWRSFRLSHDRVSEH